MKPQGRQRNKSDSSLHCGMASRQIPRQCSTSSFNWPEATSFVKGNMRSTKWVLSLICGLVFTSVALSQDGNTATPSPQNAPSSAPQLTAPTPSGSFDQVMDRAIEREHFFTAQMKHLHPL